MRTDGPFLSVKSDHEFRKTNSPLGGQDRYRALRAINSPSRYPQIMVRFTVLASGSKGNSTVVTGGRTRILVDAGLSCRELFRRMRLAGEEPETLDAIVITHEHSDHVGGLAVTARKLGIPVYFTEGTHRAWMRWLTPRRQMTYAQWAEQCRKQAAERQAEADSAQYDATCEPEDVEDAEPQQVEPRQSGCPILDAVSPRLGWETSNPNPPVSREHEDAEAPERVPSRKEEPTWLPSVEYFQAGQPFEIGDIAISPFTIPHDAADPVGFVFKTASVRMAVATDLGYIPPNVKAQLKGVDLLLLESNHDLEMLRDGPYPWSVKQRVLSRVGHLSNEAAADFLENGYDGQAAYVILAHLSESNNLPELARVAAERALSGRACLLANRLLLAQQNEPLASIYF
jgi:phosphoribosyl 1,2-cyclic phosphodiesterase